MRVNGSSPILVSPDERSPDIKSPHSSPVEKKSHKKIKINQNQKDLMEIPHGAHEETSDGYPIDETEPLISDDPFPKRTDRSDEINENGKNKRMQSNINFCQILLPYNQYILTGGIILILFMISLIFIYLFLPVVIKVKMAQTQMDLHHIQIGQFNHDGFDLWINTSLYPMPPLSTKIESTWMYLLMKNDVSHSISHSYKEEEDSNIALGKIHIPEHILDDPWILSSKFEIVNSTGLDRMIISLLQNQSISLYLRSPFTMSFSHIPLIKFRNILYQKGFIFPRSDGISFQTPEITDFTIIDGTENGLYVKSTVNFFNPSNIQCHLGPMNFHILYEEEYVGELVIDSVGLDYGDNEYSLKILISPPPELSIPFFSQFVSGENMTLTLAGHKKTTSIEMLRMPLATLRSSIQMGMEKISMIRSLSVIRRGLKPYTKFSVYNPYDIEATLLGIENMTLSYVKEEGETDDIVDFGFISESILSNPIVLPPKKVTNGTLWVPLKPIGGYVSFWKMIQKLWSKKHILLHMKGQLKTAVGDYPMQFLYSETNVPLYLQMSGDDS